MQLVIRFLVGGALVTLFAVVSDMLKPKSFAGLFGAAPSVALATLGLTVIHQGRHYAATEGRAMMIGAGAFMLYAIICNALIARGRRPVALIAVGALGAWIAVALLGWALTLRG